MRGQQKKGVHWKGVVKYDIVLLEEKHTFFMLRIILDWGITRVKTYSYITNKIKF